MDESKEIELQQLLDISRQMLEFAKNNDWEKLPDLESSRKEIMLSFFETQNSADNLSRSPAAKSVKVEQTIKDVLSINEEIEQLAQQEKVIIAQQLKGLKKKQNVHSAYLQNK